MGLREEQTELTRRRILDAFLELSTEPGAGKVSVAAVSRRSGVSPATIYRHFADRDALVHAAANERLTAGADEQVTSWGLAEFDTHLRQLWRDLAANIRVAREGALSETGREMRVARFAQLRPSLAAALADHGVDPDSPDGRRALATIAALFGAAAFLDLHDRQGLTADEAVDTAIWAIAHLLESLGIDPTTFRIT